MASLTEPRLMSQSLGLHKPKISCKRQINFQGSSAPSTPAVSRRNARERNRVKLVNNGFATLRNHVPTGKKNKKLSKVETLRSAVDYIKQLKMLLGGTSQGMDLGYYPEDDQSVAAESDGTPPGLPGAGGQTACDDYATLTAVSPSCSVADSPASSLVSDTSSYENICPDESDLLDFTIWFS